MTLVLVAHGYNADGNSIWFPYLRRALEADGLVVDVPDLPRPDAPQPGPWLDALRNRLAGARPADTVLVGHSIGGVAVLRLLQQHDPETAGAFAGAVLVATPARLPAGYDPLAGFFAEPFDWPRLRRAAGRYRVLTAADDPVLAPDQVGHVREFVAGLAATAVVTATGGHYGLTPDERIDLPEAARLVLDCAPALLR